MTATIQNEARYTIGELFKGLNKCAIFGQPLPIRSLVYVKEL